MDVLVYEENDTRKQNFVPIVLGCNLNEDVQVTLFEEGGFTNINEENKEILERMIPEVDPCFKLINRTDYGLKETCRAMIGRVSLSSIIRKKIIKFEEFSKTSKRPSGKRPQKTEYVTDIMHAIDLYCSAVSLVGICIAKKTGDEFETYLDEPQLRCQGLESTSST